MTYSEHELEFTFAKNYKTLVWSPFTTSGPGNEAGLVSQPWSGLAQDITAGDCVNSTGHAGHTIIYISMCQVVLFAIISFDRRSCI